MHATNLLQFFYHPHNSGQYVAVGNFQGCILVLDMQTKVILEHPMFMMIVGEPFELAQFCGKNEHLLDVHQL